jgi:hypothetical protein
MKQDIPMTTVAEEDAPALVRWANRQPRHVRIAVDVFSFALLSVIGAGAVWAMLVRASDHPSIFGF